MDSLAVKTPVNALDEFCAAVISRHKEHWPPTEKDLVKEFTAQFAPPLFSGPTWIEQFAGRLGIKISLVALPDDLHGLNCSCEGQTEIILNEAQHVPGSREQTLFHELREVIEYRFRDLGYPTVKDSELEDHAEDFATNVRMESCTKDIGQYVEMAQSLDKTWKRWVAGVGVVLMVIVGLLSCALVPYLEENLPKKRST